MKSMLDGGGTEKSEGGGFLCSFLCSPFQLPRSDLMRTLQGNGSMFEWSRGGGSIGEVQKEEGMVQLIKTVLGQDERCCVLLAQLLNINSMVYFFFSLCLFSSNVFLLTLILP